VPPWERKAELTSLRSRRGRKSVNKSLIVVAQLPGMLYHCSIRRALCLEKLPRARTYSIAARHSRHLGIWKTTGAIFSIWCPDDLWQTPYSTILRYPCCA
jgi:hypothetical protein